MGLRSQNSNRLGQNAPKVGYFCGFHLNYWLCPYLTVNFTLRTSRSLQLLTSYFRAPFTIRDP